MLGVHNEVWVTSALSDKDMEKVLVLYFSLKQALTSRKIAVLYSSQVSPRYRRILNHYFDFTVLLDDNLNDANLPLEDFAKLFCFALPKGFGKCVYLSPACLFFKNADDVFNRFQNSKVLLLEDISDSSLFMCQPDLQEFDLMMAWIKSNERKDLGNVSVLRGWLGRNGNSAKSSRFLNNVFGITLKNGIFLPGPNDDLALVNLQDYTLEFGNVGADSKNIIGKMVSDFRLKIMGDHNIQNICNFAELPAYAPSFSDYSNEPIAIIGMSCRYPGANSTDEFWDLLKKGIDATSTPPSFRWMMKDCSRHTEGSRTTNAGFLKIPVDKFDAKFFNISPLEAEYTDPQCRIALTVLWEGLEDACVDPQRLRGSNTSVFYGIWTNHYADILRSSLSKELFRSFLGNSIGACANKIARLLGLTGANIATESGCSSSMVAVHLACNELRKGTTNLSLVCGANLLLNPFDNSEISTAISPAGHCKTFSEDADGFARSDGVGVLILKRYSEAIRDGDKIRGLIRGTAVSQEGLSPSVGIPTVESEARTMQEALFDANLSPEDISYVEAHGTGTIVGDKVEIAAIAQAYYSPNRIEPLKIGSVKTNVGHTESCSGITGIHKVTLAMENMAIPAHLNISKLNPSLNLEDIPAEIPLELTEWKPVDGKSRKAGVSSFGITGTNGHVIIEEPPQNSGSKTELVFKSMNRSLHLVKISAKTEEALSILLDLYRDAIYQNNNALADIAFSANIGRADFHKRAVIMINDKKEKDESIMEIFRGEPEECSKLQEKAGQICFLFTGQGSQYDGMANLLYSTCPIFRIYFDYCAKILEESYKINIYNAIGIESKVEITVNRTIYSQPAIFSVEYALSKLWESWGVKPDYVLGHSVGEYAAAVVAGVLEVEDAIKLVAERSQLIDELPPGKMLVVRASFEEVETAMEIFAGGDNHKILDFAALNSSEQTVVAGDTRVILEFEKFCVNNKIYDKPTMLKTTHAFHSKHMDPILEKFRQVTITVKNTESPHSRCQFISGMNATLMRFDQMDADYWVQHTRKKVNFLNASKLAVKVGCKIFIEIGPNAVLTPLTVMNNDGLKLTCLPSLKRGLDEWSTLLSALAQLYVKGVTVNWAGFDKFFSRRKVRLPHYPFKGERYWPDVINPREKEIHPLIGSEILNASPTKIFQNEINFQTHEYLKDHAIGEKVIFPGAGFLEMCLAAGFATLQGNSQPMQKPTRSMKIESFEILAPLAIEDHTRLQTVVEYDCFKGGQSTWDSVAIKIYKFAGNTQEEKWVLHATAKFSFHSVGDKDKEMDFKKDQYRANLSEKIGKVEDTDFYKKIENTGIKYGAAFKSLKNICKLDETTLIANVNVASNLTEEISKPHLIHTILLDAMFQGIWALKLNDNMEGKLLVPISVGKLCWLLDQQKEKETRGKYFVYANKECANGKEYLTVLLLDSSDTVVASMTDLQFASTTAKIMEAASNSVSKLPDMWEETWSSEPGPVEQAIDKMPCTMSRIHLYELYDNIVNKYNNISSELETTLKDLDKLAYYYILRSMYQCGFQPSLNTSFSATELQMRLNIMEPHRKLFLYFLHVLEEEGILKLKKGNTLTLHKFPPCLKQVNIQLKILTANLVKEFKPASVLIQIGSNLCNILQGKDKAVDILFDCKVNYTLENFYENYGKTIGVTNLYAEVCKHYLVGSGDAEGMRLRILEVGAGTGWISEPLLDQLAASGMKFEYYYTDISASFFPGAEKRFKKYVDHIIFKTLNIEDDPVSQGFVPGYFNIILASEVIHATRNIKESLAHVKKLLKPGGRFDLIEQTRKIRFGTVCFGTLDGYWRFMDEGLRKDHCTLNIKQWSDTLQSMGFKVLQTYPAANYRHSCISSLRKDFRLSLEPALGPRKTWLVFHLDENETSKFLLKMIPNMAGRHVIVVKLGSCFSEKLKGDLMKFIIRGKCEQDFLQVMKTIQNNKDILLEGVLYCWSLQMETAQEKILMPFFYAAKSLIKCNIIRKGLRLITLTSGISNWEEKTFSYFQRTSLLGCLKSIQNEHTELHCRLIDIGKNGTMLEKMEIFYELWRLYPQVQVAFHGTTRLTPKLTPVTPNFHELEIPPSLNQFQLLLPDTKVISDLQFGPLQLETLSSREIEVEVKSASLNFKDVFNILKPSEDFTYSNGVGVDYAGVVIRVHPEVTKWRVGDNVCGLNVKLSPLSSHLHPHEDDVIPIPNDMTFHEACTFPTALTTAYHCLIEVAKVKKSDIVLIHTASGGVGIAAIEICKRIGATIIATAGSKRKQNFLRNLGIEHIFCSRSIEYSDFILQVTNGRGVDVVLNSLTGEGFIEATLKTCAKGARYVEMSKLSIWTTEKLQKLRIDIQYTTVDINTLDFRSYVSKLKDLIFSKEATPIPHVRFSAVEIREALDFLHSAKHIGKVVVTMPEIRRFSGKREIFSPMFSNNGTYIITGGLGGIGFEICKWMVKMGAKYILLVGRNPPISKIQQDIIRLNNDQAARILSVQLDVSSYFQCETLFTTQLTETGYPIIRGVIHAAGILNDALIENHSWATFSSVFPAKINATWNLHQLTKDNPRLEHFVLFSSFCSVFGFPGQSNHSAGNIYEDAIAHYRNSVGLPATSINWGQWGETGMATELELYGFKSMTTQQAIGGLEFALKTHRTQIGIYNVESLEKMSFYAPFVPSYFNGVVWKNDSDASLGKIEFLNSQQFWKQYSEMECEQDKMDFLRGLLNNFLKILRRHHKSITPNYTDMQELGLDSLELIELRNLINAHIGDGFSITVELLRECKIFESLSNMVFRLIEGFNIGDVDYPSVEEVAHMIKQDSRISHSIMAQPHLKKPEVREISNVLITGVTGTLGPYLLRELSHYRDIAQITCLIRPKADKTGMEILHDVLGDNELLEKVNMTKITCVEGNVAEPQLGIAESIWKNLCDNVDAVFHCAAKVNHVEMYANKDDHNNTIRAVNVEGLKNILKFCCTGTKLKHLYHASSIVSVTTLDENGEFSENWPQPNDFDGITSLGYPISKFIGDLIMKQAVTERGIPGKVFRFPMMSGEYETGRFKLEKNHSMYRFLFNMRNKVVENVDYPFPVLPVDICAKLSLQIFFNSDAPDDIYNITNNNINMESEFVSVALRFGYDLQKLESAEYAQKLKEPAIESSHIELLKDFYRSKDNMMTFRQKNPAFTKWRSEDRQCNSQTSGKLSKYVSEFAKSQVARTSTMEFIYKDLVYGKQQGYFTKFGL